MDPNTIAQAKEWSSPSFGEILKVNVLGSSGTPILFFGGNHGGDTEKLLAQLSTVFSFQLSKGFNRIYVPEAPEGANLCQDRFDPKKRLILHSKFEEYVIHELVPFIKRESGIDSLLIAGTKFGATQASVMAFKHPEKFLKLIHVCGPLDIRPYFGDVTGKDVYYNNPIEFVPLMRDESLIKAIGCMDIRLISHYNSDWKDQAYQLSDAMNYLQISHHLDVWGSDTPFNMSTMTDMLLKHVP